MLRPRPRSCGPGPATVTRRLCTIAGFYRYAVEEDLLAHSPAVHVRRPRLDYESHATGLDRNEIGALLVAAGLGPPAQHALISLLALNGLRVSEATGADIEALGVERGHRTLAIVRKGGKKVTIPLAPRTARAIDLAIGERCEGPIFLTTTGTRLDRHGAGRIVRKIARQAGIAKAIGPHTLRHALSLYVRVAIVAVGGQADLRPALFDYLLLAAACCGNLRNGSASQQRRPTATRVAPNTASADRRHTFITAALDAGVPLRDVQEAASHADPRTTMRYDRARVSLDRHATYIVAAYVAGAAR